MPEYLSPGVYVEEVDTGNKPIEGVATSTVGFLGIAERGPVEATLVTSFSEYVRTFGKYVGNRYLARGVEGFFQNGGKRCFVARVVSHDGANPAVAATLATTGAEMTISAIGPGTWANGRLAFKISDAGLTLQDPTLFKLTVMYWDPTVSLPAAIVDPTDAASATNPNRREPTLLEVYDNLSADQQSANFYERRINDVSSLVTVQRNAAGRPANEPVPAVPMPSPAPFTNGVDGAAVTLADFQGDPAALPGARRGLLALEEVDEIAVLCCPDEGVNPGITTSLIDQCGSRTGLRSSRRRSRPGRSQRFGRPSPRNTARTTILGSVCPTPRPAFRSRSRRAATSRESTPAATSSVASTKPRRTRSSAASSSTRPIRRAGSSSR
jgi:hypothetical protein